MLRIFITLWAEYKNYRLQRAKMSTLVHTKLILWMSELLTVSNTNENDIQRVTSFLKSQIFGDLLLFWLIREILPAVIRLNFKNNQQHNFQNDQWYPTRNFRQFARYRAIFDDNRLPLGLTSYGSKEIETKLKQPPLKHFKNTI